ncbi:MAG: lipid-A-disaccharide synthase [Gammaproteobacteria bacterium]|nr:lipid-A-disaccharide synthase [Gammaproteobacteria bacterium]
MLIGILAGEPSGDLLGAQLMDALRAEWGGDVRFIGVGGVQMRARGLDSIVEMGTFAVNGFVEPIKRLPSLVQAFRRLRDRLLQERPSAFVGVDFNVFNLILERALKRRGVRTVHYVSPSVYAWRSGRTARIARAADAVLTLFPFETAYYANHPLRAEFVGHPLADEIEPEAEGGVRRVEPRRAALRLPADATVVALLPGSRRSELRLHVRLFADTAKLLAPTLARPVFLVPTVSADDVQLFRELAGNVIDGLDVRWLPGRSREALAAADVALIKSGTGTLEAMLLGTPMVVTYRLPAVSYAIVKALLRTPFVALPNILAGRELVPELLQRAASPASLALALQAQLEDNDAMQRLRATFRDIHLSLRRGASVRAARVVLSVAAG